MDRRLRLTLIFNTGDADALSVAHALSPLSPDLATPQLVDGILPVAPDGAQMGVLLWATDLQGLVSDLQSFGSYLSSEDEVLAAVNTLGIKT